MIWAAIILFGLLWIVGAVLVLGACAVASRADAQADAAFAAIIARERADTRALMRELPTDESEADHHGEAE